ncbi:serine-enriched protein [Gigaspora margarita]|uniref:Serine-enriched protein n=1 Tax=Gigaspora margarita TaxID=4874 RepID=A0A8H3X4J8_GIGMA|nr:serine-enriched protein [Gigaspora margarita]
MNKEPIRNFSNLLENPKDFDVKIKVGETPNIKEFKAHSIVLSARSDYFKTALSSQWARIEDGIIIFDKPNISPKVFEILINYIYTGTFSNNNEVDLFDIFIAADEIVLIEITQQVKKRLRNEANGYLKQAIFNSEPSMSTLYLAFSNDLE